MQDPRLTESVRNGISLQAGSEKKERRSDLREDDAWITRSADSILPVKNILTRICFEGDAIGTIQNECDTMEDV